MKTTINRLRTLLIASALMVGAPAAQAICYKVTDVGKGVSQLPQEVADMGYIAAKWGMGSGDSIIANLSFGTISIGTGEDSLAPAGTVLASADMPFLEKALSDPYAANQIVYKCALSDADSLYEIYALAASYGAEYGGKAVSDVEGGYRTPAQNIAYRITNLKTGLYYTGEWQERKLTADDYITVGSNIYIPASSFSSATFELIKSDDAFGLPTRDAFRQITVAQGYVALRTPTINTTNATGKLAYPPSSGYVSAVWSMRKGNTTVIQGKNCLLKDFDQVVTLPTISASDLRNGMTSSNTFNVAINCEKGAISGTESSDSKPPVAMGFLVTQPTALAQANALGLQTGAGGISHLLDNNYGTEGVASGVGIRIYAGSRALNLLSSSATTGTGSEAGWYGFTELMSKTGLLLKGGKSYAGVFTASLEQLPGETAQGGSVNAQAQIVVSLQ